MQHWSSAAAGGAPKPVLTPFKEKLEKSPNKSPSPPKRVSPPPAGQNNNNNDENENENKEATVSTLTAANLAKVAAASDQTKNKIIIDVNVSQLLKEEASRENSAMTGHTTGTSSGKINNNNNNVNQFTFYNTRMPGTNNNNNARRAVALSGAGTAAANAGAKGMHLSGTKVNYTTPHILLTKDTPMGPANGTNNSSTVVNPITAALNKKNNNSNNNNNNNNNIPALNILASAVTGNNNNNNNAIGTNSAGMTFNHHHSNNLTASGTLPKRASGGNLFSGGYTNQNHNNPAGGSYPPSNNINSNNNNNNNTANTAGPGMATSGDVSDEEVLSLLKELLGSVYTSNVISVLRDVAEVIDNRSIANFDLSYRDYFLEQSIRDVLLELTRMGGEATVNVGLTTATLQQRMAGSLTTAVRDVDGECGPLLVAVRFIKHLIPIAYTSPAAKYPRLCRHLTSIMQCGRQGPTLAAQETYRQLLLAEQQYQPEAPLKNFIPKELKDGCELALLQLHGRVTAQPPSGSTTSQAHFLYIMSASSVAAEVSGRYISIPLRNQIIQLATTLAGVGDTFLSESAYQCLVAVFRYSSHLRMNEVVVESRRVCDEAVRSLNTNHHSESSILSTLKVLKALLSSRSSAVIERQITPQVCVLITEQLRISKSPQVRACVCDLIPIIAPVDISSPPRRVTYTGFIMEPVKNVRSETGKAREIGNVGAFIESVGYTVFDQTNRTNLESILHRYVVRPETQQACWRVIAAIVFALQHPGNFPRRVFGDSLKGSRGSSERTKDSAIASPTTTAEPTPTAEASPAQTMQQLEELVQRSLASLSPAALSAELVGYLHCIQQDMPSLQVALQEALDKVVDNTLHLPEQTTETPATTGSRHHCALHDSTVPANPFKTRSAGVSSLVELVDTSHVESDPLITAPSSSTGPPDNSTTVPSAPNQGDLTVALRAFSRRPVLSVQHLDDIKNKIIPFQRHEDVLVREASSTAVVQGLNQWVLFAKNTKTTTYSTRVTDILDIFVKNVLSEMDPDCRLKEIALLTEAVNLRPFLSDPRILPSLLSFLTGPQSIHEKTVELLVSLTLDSKSSSSVQAVQQNLLVIIESSVVVLEYTHEVRTLIRSLTDLQTFTRLCVRPLSNHLGRIFYALKKNLKEDNIADVVILSILKTLDVILITLAGEEKTVLQYQDDVAELYSPIVSILKESCSPSLSHAAVSVLVSMNRMCAPLQQQQGATHQQELIHVLTHLFTSTNHLAKDELLNMLTLLGQIGAVDPASNAVLVRPKKKEDATVQDEADMELTYDYTVIVYRTLSRMLDMTLPDAVCSQALRTLLQYMRFTQDKKDLVGGVHAVRAVLQIARRSSDSPALRIEALNVLSAITTLRHERIARLVLPEIVVLLEQLWVPSDFILFRCVLEVVSALKPGKLSGKEQSESWAWLYPRLVDVALQDHTETREFSLRVVEIILNASYIPPHCIPIVFPMLIHFVQQPEQLVEVRGQSLCAAVHIVCDLKVVQYFSSLMHGMRTLVRHCQVNEDLGPRLSTAGVRESLKVLTALHPTGRSVIKQLRDRLSDTDERSSGAGYSNNVFGRRQIPTSSSAATPYYPGDEIISDEDEESASIIHTINSNGSAPELSLLWRHVEWGLRMKENKLREWFAELQKLIIIVSPSPAFRMMVDLFDKHEPLRRELFHPSFKLLYETITADQMKKINDVLTIALNSNDSELSSKCLALSDYLDHHQPSIKAEVLEQLRDHRGVGTPETETNTIRSTHSLTQTQQSEEELTISRRFGDHFGSKEDHTNKQDEGSFVFDSEHNSPADGPPQQKPTHRTSHTRVSGALRRGEEDRFDSNLFNMFQPLSQSFSNFHKHADPSSDAVLTHGNSNSSVAQYASLQAAAASAAHIPFRPNVLFSTENIVKAAERTNMYDKAVSYIENKVHIALKTYRYHRMPKEVIQKIVWPLAWLYSQREMHDSVVGLFHAIRYEGEDNDGFGFELLRWWNKAQQVYTKTVNVEMIRKGMDPSMVEGYVRTLCFCGNWNKALQVAQEACFKSAAPPSSNVAVCGAMSAWMLGKWEAVDQLAEAITERNNGPVRMFFLNGSLLRSALQEKSPAVLEELRQSLSQSKIAMEDSTRTLLSISYSHAYDNLTMVQHFTEMDEIIDYSLSKTPKAQQQLLDRWTARFKQLKRDSLLPSLRSIMLYSLVLRSTDMSEMVLHFCETLGKDYPQLTHWAMDWLCKDNTEGGEENADITVGYITHLWGHGKRREAVSRMESFLNESGERLIETNSECYGKAQLRLGMWKQELNADSFWKRGSREEKLQHFHKAIRAAPSNYEAWHSWGLINYRVQQRDHTLTPEEQHTFVEAAHEGFVAAICRCKDSFEALPGIMRLLQLWVIHNGVSLLKEGVADSISRISIDHWVLAIPQLIGHLSNESHDVREVICMILRTLCEVHPQAVIFPLIVVLMSDEMQSNPSPMQKRKQAIVQTIIQYCPKRIRNEAETVAKLLGDVSAIPIEKIRENLSQVATAWNPNAEYEEDVDEVMYRLQNTMDIFEANVKHLLYTVGNIGKYVQGIVEDYKKGNKEKAAGIVNQLVDEISKHVQDKLGKEPQKALEPLLRLRNLSIAVFGTYDFAEKEFPTIASFSSKLDVIPSKKRPRRIQLNGSDGCLYVYCLKGNEDIRMDERVMQLFGMVNVLLGQSRTSNNAQIHRFPVIPISNNIGLLGWVENANTINNTICNYRANISHVRSHHESSVLRNYVESFGQWERLTIIQRAEVLDYVMNCPDCEAVDVARAMWHRSNTAEQWLERRAVFTTSLASMSIVGYVFGLGDRHLGNILLSMSTGKIVHIDFGDSFDVGRLRHVLPETVPFRLTRMLTNAMEIFGVDGIFRASATGTQTTLQKNRDSIMALLSAFVYDPIVQHKGRMKNMMEKSRSPQDVVERIRNKLRGVELAVPTSELVPFNTTTESCKRPDLLYMSKAFDDNAQRDQRMALGPDEQVDFLINEAVRPDNYTTLYFGWGPLW